MANPKEMPSLAYHLLKLKLTPGASLLLSIMTESHQACNQMIATCVIHQNVKKLTEMSKGWHVITCSILDV